MPKNGYFSRKSRKTAFLRVNPHFGGFGPFLGPLGRGFYINPRAPSWKGVGGPGGTLREVPGTPGPRIRDPGDRGPDPPPPGGRPGEPLDGVPGGPGVPEGPRGQPREGGFTSTPRAGAPRYRRGPRGPGPGGVSREAPGGIPEGPRPAPPSPGTAGGRPPEGVGGVPPPPSGGAGSLWASSRPLGPSMYRIVLRLPRRAQFITKR